MIFTFAQTCSLRGKISSFFNLLNEKLKFNFPGEKFYQFFMNLIYIKGKEIFHIFQLDEKIKLKIMKKMWEGKRDKNF